MKSQTESTPAKDGFDFPACLFIAIYSLLWVFRKVHGSSRHNSIIIFIALHSLPLDLLIAYSLDISALWFHPKVTWAELLMAPRPWETSSGKNMIQSHQTHCPMESRGISPKPHGLIPGEHPEKPGEVSPHAMGLERGSGSAQPWSQQNRPEFVKNFTWNLSPEGNSKVEQGRSTGLLFLRNLVQILETKRNSRKGRSSWLTPILQVPEGPEQFGRSSTL